MCIIYIIINVVFSLVFCRFFEFGTSIADIRKSVKRRACFLAFVSTWRIYEEAFVRKRKELDNERGKDRKRVNARKRDRE